MRNVIRHALCVAVLSLAACTSSQQAAVKTLVSDVVPVVAAVIPGAPPVLTEAAKIACAGQSAANQAGQRDVSMLLGAACAW